MRIVLCEQLKERVLTVDSKCGSHKVEAGDGG